MGPVDHWVGRLAASLGRLDEAIDWLDAAAVLAEQIGAWPFLALTLDALADTLASRGNVDDHRQAAGYRRRASELAGQPGLARPDDAFMPRADEWSLRRDEGGWELMAGGGAGLVVADSQPVLD